MTISGPLDMISEVVTVGALIRFGGDDFRLSFEIEATSTNRGLPNGQRTLPITPSMLVCFSAVALFRADLTT